MAHATNRLLCSKSILHCFAISSLPRFCSTDIECSKLVQTECVTPSKDLDNLRNESNPPKLVVEISRQHRYQLLTPSTDTGFRFNTETQLSILNIFRIESDPEKLVRFFKQLTEQPSFRRCRSPYTITVKKLALAQQFDAIEEILDHSLQVREISSEGFFSRIILLYGIAGMPQNAIKTFNQMKSFNISPTVMSFNALLNALVESKTPQNSKLAHDLYKHIDSFGISANLKTYNIVVKAICEMNEHEAALSFLDEMRKHGCEPHSSTYDIVLSAFYQQGKYMEAADLLAKMVETCFADASTYNIMMVILCECDKTSDAEKLLDEMVSTGLKPDVSHFNTLIAGFLKENNLTEAERIFQMCLARFCDPNALTYHTPISFLLKEGDFDMAYEYCIVMLRNWMPELKIAKMLIDGLVKNNKFENAQEVIEGMKKNLPAFYHKDLENITRGIFFGGKP